MKISVARPSDRAGAFTALAFVRAEGCREQDLNRMKTFLLASLRGLRLPGFKPARVIFTALPFGRAGICREQDLNLRTPTGQRPERCAVDLTWLSLHAKLGSCRSLKPLSDRSGAVGGTRETRRLAGPGRPGAASLGGRRATWREGCGNICTTVRRRLRVRRRDSRSTGPRRSRGRRRTASRRSRRRTRRRSRCHEPIPPCRGSGS